MKASFPPLLRKHRASGIIRVRIHTPRGAQWLSTGQTSFARARTVCDQAMIERLQMAACAETLTADAISRFVTGRRFTCADIVEAWAAETVIDLAPDTFNAYRTTLNHWMQFCECGSVPLSSIKRGKLFAFVNESGVAGGTRRGRLAALRSFYKFASAAGYCIGNLADRVRVNVRDLIFEQLEPKETIPITPEEYRLLMDSPKLTGFYRHATALAYWLGYRLRDIASYQLASIQDEVSTIYMQKTGKRLELPLDDPLLGGGELRRIMLEIVEQTPAGSKFCFPEKRAVALNPKRRANLSVAYQRILKAHGIAGKRFHSLRHAFAARLDAAGLTLEQIAQRLGHASTDTTKTYTDHSTNTTLS